MSFHHVCFVVGARPNFMKAAPVYRALAKLRLPQPDVFLGIGSGTHGEQTATAIVGVERVLVEHLPSLVVVVGDVNSTLAAALAASKLQIAVAHIEAGLRTSMPEEANRRLTDYLSQILLAHSPGPATNLTREGIEPKRSPPRQPLCARGRDAGVRGRRGTDLSKSQKLEAATLEGGSAKSRHP